MTAYTAIFCFQQYMFVFHCLGLFKFWEFVNYWFIYRIFGCYRKENKDILWYNSYINSYSVPARNWKWRGATLEKGHFSASKTMKKGNIVIFSYLKLKMSFSTTFSARCINASTWLIVYIYFITYVQKCTLKSEDQ